MHPHRRPGPRSGRGVVASALVLLGTLSACSSGTISIDEHDLSDTDRAACDALVDALPDTLAGESRREVEADGGPGAAWGDPAYVLTCGVPEPSDYEPTAECSDILGVGWWVADDELGDLSEDAHAVALSRTPYVEVLVPAERRTDGIDRALAELAPAITEHLADGRSCL